MNSRHATLTTLLISVFLLASCSLTPAPKLTPEPTANRATLLLPGYDEAFEVSYEVIGNQAIFEGDIILGTVDANGELHSPYEISELEAQGVAIVGKSDYHG